MKYATAIGESTFDIPEGSVRKIARSVVASVKPTKLITDYSDGWSALVLDEARKYGVPYIGVLPFPVENEVFYRLSRHASSNLILCPSKKDFLDNPFEYFSWMNRYVDEVFLYLDMSKPGIKRNTVKALKGKMIRNLYKAR